MRRRHIGPRRSSETSGHTARRAPPPPTSPRRSRSAPPARCCRTASSSTMVENRASPTVAIRGLVFAGDASGARAATGAARAARKDARARNPDAHQGADRRAPRRRRRARAYEQALQKTIERRRHGARPAADPRHRSPTSCSIRRSSTDELAKASKELESDCCARTTTRSCARRKGSAQLAFPAGIRTARDGPKSSRIWPPSPRRAARLPSPQLRGAGTVLAIAGDVDPAKAIGAGRPPVRRHAAGERESFAGVRRRTAAGAGKARAKR